MLIISFNMTDVFHVPEATINLFSIRSAVITASTILSEFTIDIFHHRSPSVIRKTGRSPSQKTRKQYDFLCTMSKDARLLTRSDARAGLLGMVGPSAQTALAVVESPELYRHVAQALATWAVAVWQNKLRESW